jgi:hypothetical protein
MRACRALLILLIRSGYTQPLIVRKMVKVGSEGDLLSGYEAELQRTVTWVSTSMTSTT